MRLIPPKNEVGTKHETDKNFQVLVTLTPATGSWISLPVANSGFPTGRVANLIFSRKLHGNENILSQNWGACPSHPLGSATVCNVQLSY